MNFFYFFFNNFAIQIGFANSNFFYCVDGSTWKTFKANEKGLSFLPNWVNSEPMINAFWDWFDNISLKKIATRENPIEFSNFSAAEKREIATETTEWTESLLRGSRNRNIKGGCPVQDSVLSVLEIENRLRIENPLVIWIQYTDGLSGNWSLKYKTENNLVFQYWVSLV